MTAAEAALQCRTCGETRHWLGRIELVPAPHPWLPWFMIERRVVSVDRCQVSRWASSHIGPIVVSHFHLHPPS